MVKSTMKAVRVHAFGGPEMLSYEDVPTPMPGPGEVLIKIEAAAVNYADLVRRRNGPYPHPTHLPTTLGIEVAGTVAALGEGVDSPSLGSSVFAVLPGALGGYAQYATAPAVGVIPMPAGLSHEVASTLVVSGVTALQILRDVVALKPGESVFIPSAAGGVGTYAVQIAKLLGAGTIIAAAGSEERRQAALTLGATHVVDSRSGNWSTDVLNITGGVGADIVLEMVGGRFFDQALASLADFGRLVVFGQVGSDPAQFAPLELQSGNQSVFGYYVGGRFAKRKGQAVEALKSLIGHILKGELEVQIGHTLPLAKAVEAHELLESGTAKGKVVLKPWA